MHVCRIIFLINLPRIGAMWSWVLIDFSVRLKTLLCSLFCLPTTISASVSFSHIAYLCSSLMTRHCRTCKIAMSLNDTFVWAINPPHHIAFPRRLATKTINPHSAKHSFVSLRVLVHPTCTDMLSGRSEMQTREQINLNEVTSPW